MKNLASFENEELEMSQAQSLYGGREVVKTYDCTSGNCRKLDKFVTRNNGTIKMVYY